MSVFFIIKLGDNMKVYIDLVLILNFLFDTLIMDQDIKISDTRTIKREKIRDSFVHMRWYKGVNECFKLFDWDNGIDNEYNPNSQFYQNNHGNNLQNTKILFDHQLHNNHMN